MDPGSGGGVFTGQSVFSSPALTAFTSARLSFFVRPFTEGTVTGGSLAAESLPTLDAVLEAVLGVDGVDEAVPTTPCGTAAESAVPAGGIPSTPGDGRASLVAAQASELTRANKTNTGIEKYLFAAASGIRNCELVGPAAGTA